MEQNLKALINNSKLKFIFVGGKGGVGKTTTASGIALAISQVREKVLIISTDPAHNLSDAFSQQLSNEPTHIKGTHNLWGMEIDPKKAFNWGEIDQAPIVGETELISLSSLITQVPGIDEAVTILSIIQIAKESHFDVVVFDTAPTGHTVKLLGYPTVCQQFLEKILAFKDKVSLFTGMLGAEIAEKLSTFSQKAVQLKEDSESLVKLLQDSDITTFVAVCIPEFLSVYETERLVQELTNKEIDISHLVVNQIVFPSDECKKCLARYQMQYKYISQIFQLYEDFQICLMPLEDEEVRGISKLRLYADKLCQTKELPLSI